MSVDEWDNQWSEVTQRDFIKQSALSHCHKGTVGSVRRALDSLGVTVDFLEWFDDVHDVALAPIHHTTPHTFVLIAWANHNLYSSHEVFLNPQRYKSICRVVEQVKPVRSHFDFLVGAKLNISMQLAATTRLMQTGRLSSQTVPVQVPAMQQATSAILHLNRRRYAVARFYLI
jgi:phage tail P2-like protein